MPNTTDHQVQLQVWKSARDFMQRLFGSMAQLRGDVPPLPRVPLVLRIGVVGHLQVQHPASVEFALQAVLDALRDFVHDQNPRFHERLYGIRSGAPLDPVELRLITQLACGVDQMAATAGLRSGYKLHAVLPCARNCFAADVQRHCGSTRSFDRLLSRADRVLELDHCPSGVGVSELDSADYGQASAIVLAHSDLLVVVAHEHATGHEGGTAWMEQRATEIDLPVVRIPIDRPSDAVISWTQDRRRESRRVFGRMNNGIQLAVFEHPLIGLLYGSEGTMKAPQIGFLERRMTRQLDISRNAVWWDDRWRLDNSVALADCSMGAARSQIDADLKDAKVWADHRAGAMAEIVRGAFLFCTTLGVLAVMGALAGIVAPAFAKTGKWFELLCLVVMGWFVLQSKRYEWRAQWLSLRELERCLDQEAWMLMLGRLRRYRVASDLIDFRKNPTAVWCDYYLRAIIRRCSFPSVRLDADYLRTSEQLVLENLIRSQMIHYRKEAESNHLSDESLEGLATACMIVAAVITAVYLVGPHALQMIIDRAPLGVWVTLLSTLKDVFQHAGPIVTFVAATAPAAAAGMAAIRSYGEYGQLAIRFRGTGEALMAFESAILRLASSASSKHHSASSQHLADAIEASTDVMFQEVAGWRAVLHNKQIELS